jgi:hypothetical protein
MSVLLSPLINTASDARRYMSQCRQRNGSTHVLDIVLVCSNVRGRIRVLYTYDLKCSSRRNQASTNTGGIFLPTHHSLGVHQHGACHISLGVPLELHQHAHAISPSETHLHYCSYFRFPCTFIGIFPEINTLYIQPVVSRMLRNQNFFSDLFH